MSNKLKTIALALAMSATTASATAEEWIEIATSRTHTFDARAGSLERTANNKGTPVVALTVRMRSLGADRQISFERNYVSVEDCGQGQGTLVTVTLEGKHRFSNEFIIGGGNVASIIAEVVCGVAFRPAASSQQTL